MNVCVSARLLGGTIGELCVFACVCLCVRASAQFSGVGSLVESRRLLETVSALLLGPHLGADGK